MNNAPINAWPMNVWPVEGAPAPPPTLPGDLLEALKLAVEATATFGDIAGGYASTILPRNPTYPLVVGNTRTGRFDSRAGRTSSYDRVVVPIGLRVYAEGPDQAKALSDALHEDIKGVCLDFTGALATKLLPDGEPMSGFVASRGRAGIVHWAERKYCCRVRRAKVSVKL